MYKYHSVHMYLCISSFFVKRLIEVTMDSSLGDCIISSKEEIRDDIVHSVDLRQSFLR